MKSSNLFSPFLAALLLIPSSLSAQTNLKEGQERAKEVLEEAETESLQRHRKTQRLRKDLRYISEELDREIVVDPREKTDPWAEKGKGLPEYSKGGLFRIGQLRKHGNIDARLDPALDRLEKLFNDLSTLTYAEDYARGLVKAISHELRWISEEGRGEEDILALLDSHLVLPDSMPTDPAAASKRFPTNLPLDKFKKLGPVKIFILKHRMSQPKKYTRTTPDALTDNRHNVQIGVELVGMVNRHSKSVDQDYTFDIGNVHIELTPEWRKTHRGIKLPVTGQKVRAAGWSYFDVFHKAEEEYDPEDPTYGKGRWTQWEIHPVMQIEILKK